MNGSRSPYAEVLEFVQDSHDLAEIGRIATYFRSHRDPNFGPWFKQAIQSRYREFTRTGLPDGPCHNRLDFVR